MSSPDSSGARPSGVPALLIAAAGLLALAGAWNSPFTTYDDPIHVSANPKLAADVPVSSYFVPVPDETYFPLTLLSYRLDRWAYSGWLPGLAGSWAPGVRTTTWLCHVLAALALLGVMRRIGAGRGGALFVALAFALHPTACETVCWASERKTALCGLFVFLTVWLWLRGEGRPWRVPVALLAYAAALLSKPSALGAVPLLVFVEAFGGARALQDQAGAGQGAPSPSSAPGGRADILVCPDRQECLSYQEASPRQSWGTAVWSLLPFVLLSGVFVQLGLKSHASFLAPPPGGSVFTALLTDVWILLRYMVNLAAPTHLSAAYGISPVVSLGDGRLWLSLAVLAGAVGFSLRVAHSRRRALFGWLWFVGALGPNLNLIAIPYLMADRYVYLALPGFFLVAVETVRGLWERGEPSRLESGSPPAGSSSAGPDSIGTRAAAALRWLAILYLVLLGGLALQRGLVWRDMYSVFADAAAKEPGSAFARYGLGMAHATAWDQLQARPEPAAKTRAEEERHKWMAEWEAVFSAVDADRLLELPAVTVTVAKYELEQGRVDSARQLLEQAALERRGMKDDPQARAGALGWLGVLEREAHRPRSAIGYFNGALQLQPEWHELYLARARAHADLAAGAAPGSAERAAHRQHAEEDLAHIPARSEWDAAAEALRGELPGP